MILEHISEEMDELALELKAKLEELSTAFEDNAAILMVKMRELKKATDEQHEHLKKEIAALRASLKETWDEWVAVTKKASLQYEFAH